MSTPESALKELTKAISSFAIKSKSAATENSPTAPQRVYWVSAGVLLNDLGTIQKLLNAAQGR